MEQVKQKVDQFCHKMGLDQYGDVPAVKKATEMTKVESQYLVLGGLVVLLLLATTPPGMWLIYTLATFTWPAYRSYKAVESPEPTDDKHWLTYWVVLGFFFTFSEVIDFIFSWVPLLQFFKLILLAYMHLSKEKGSKFLYETVVSRCFYVFRDKAGFVFDQVDEVLENMVSKGKVE